MAVKLVGIQKITTKDGSRTFAKLHFLDSSPENLVSGVSTFSEFCAWTDAYNDLVDCEVRLVYGKGYNGSAYLQDITEA